MQLQSVCELQLIVKTSSPCLRVSYHLCTRGISDESCLPFWEADTLGPQSGSSIHHNYLLSQCNLYGVLYMDGGSGFIDAFRNVIAASPSAVWVLLNGEANGEPFQPPLRVFENWVDRSTFSSRPGMVQCLP